MKVCSKFSNGGDKVQHRPEFIVLRFIVSGAFVFTIFPFGIVWFRFIDQVSLSLSGDIFGSFRGGVIEGPLACLTLCEVIPQTCDLLEIPTTRIKYRAVVIAPHCVSTDLGVRVRVRCYGRRPGTGAF